MGKMNKKGICIYCCGRGGRVGWVSGWMVRNKECAPIVKLTLSLCHNDAYKFTDDYAINKVLKFIDEHSAYGDYHVFNW